MVDVIIQDSPAPLHCHCSLPHRSLLLVRDTWKRIKRSIYVSNLQCVCRHQMKKNVWAKNVPTTSIDSLLQYGMNASGQYKWRGSEL